MRIANIDTTQGDDCPVDGARLNNQDHYVEDQVMLLDVILLTSLIIRLKIILSAENYVDIKRKVQVRIKRKVQMLFTKTLPLINLILMVIL